MSIIEVRGLTKKYGEFTAVDGISFDVRDGEIFGILGPNGAGKTTTLEMIEGLKVITSGQAVLDGKDVTTHARAVKAVIGVQLQSSAFFDGLNLKELIETFAALYGRRVDARKLLRDVELEEKWKNQVKELSGGQKQRLSIAIGLVNDPKVLFLDEPTTGLDPQARRHLWGLINAIKGQGKTIVLTTHYMEEAEVLCDRIAIMDRARIIAFDTTANLLQAHTAGSTITFAVKRSIDAGRLTSLAAVEQARHENGSWRLLTRSPSQTLPALFQLPESRELSDLNLHRPTLEDVFLNLTGHSLRE